MSKQKINFALKIITTVLVLFYLSGCIPELDQEKPNIIIILADDLGYNELGCYGQEIIETPNIDKLAEEGMRFTQFYSGSPVCAPSRCALLTGKHPGHMYIRGNDEWIERGDVWNYEAMNADPYLEGQRPLTDTTFTIGKMLQQNGYKTAIVGKWGLGSPTGKSTPNDMGFDFFYGYNCQRQAHTYYPVHLWKNREKDTLDNKSVSPHQKLSEGVDPSNPESYADYQLEDYAPELMLDETLHFMEENRDNPFFVYFATPIPHVALQAPQQWVDYYHEKFGDEEPYLGGAYFPCQYPRATYAAMISYLDEQVGEIVKKLKEMGEYENTIILFTSDNGPTYAGGADTKYFKSAYPFSEERGRAKGSLYG
jgi:arylsulfatase